MLVNYSDMPAWVKNAVKRHLGNCRPHSEVVPTETLDLGPVWHDECRRIIVARDAQGKMQVACSTYYDSLPDANRQEHAMYFGGTTGIPHGCAVLELLTYPKSATLYIHPMDMPKQITEPQIRLSGIQSAVLYLYDGLTSAGWKDAQSRYHIPSWLLDMVTRELAGLGLVSITNNGAVRVTLKGKNTQTGDNGFWYNWSESALDVIREYETKRSQA